jgi:glycosyltransferase involved in cell wall biosynthesis
MNKILFSHPTGNANARGILNGFWENNMLHSFHTSIACFPNSLVDKLAGFSLLKDFKKRGFPANVQKQTHTYPYKEMGRMLAQKFQIKRWLTHKTGRFCIDQASQYFDRQVAKYLAHHPDVSDVYCYEDSALETFQQAKKSGIRCICDLPIAYWEYGTQLMKEEAERLPEWAITLGGGISDSDEKHARKIEELELADVVVCPSRFVKNSLPAWAQDKLIIETPFGTPDTTIPLPNRQKTDHLRVLFAGSMGQRKGLGDLFAAIKLLNNDQIELVVLGSLLAPMDFYKKTLPNFTYEPTRSHDQVLELMRSCDVFCLPSIVEGRALVMQEAMSQGLPLIITPNTGGEDLVIEGETGFLVPIRSPQSIAEKINWFFENRDKIPVMGEKARNHAASYTWAKYGNMITSRLQNHIV